MWRRALTGAAASVGRAASASALWEAATGCPSEGPRAVLGRCLKGEGYAAAGTYTGALRARALSASAAGQAEWSTVDQKMAEVKEKQKEWSACPGGAGGCSRLLSARARRLCLDGCGTPARCPQRHAMQMHSDPRFPLTLRKPDRAAEADAHQLTAQP